MVESDAAEGNPRSRGGLESRSVRVAGESVRVWDSGGPADLPVVVLLHGLASTAVQTWGAVMESLTGAYRVIAPDLPGHGGYSRRRFSVEGAASHVRDVLAGVGVGEYVVVGHSMGGVVAQRLAVDAPPGLTGAVFVSTACRFERSGPFRRWRLLLKLARRCAGFVPRRVYGFLVEVVYFSKLPGSIAAKERSVCSSHDWRRVVEALTSVLLFDSSSWVGGVRVPTCVVATARDRVVPLATQLRLAARMNAALVVEDFPHNPMECDPPRAGSVLREALASVRSAR